MQLTTWIKACVLGAAIVHSSRPAHATWSIIAVDVRTGEVVVASATCLTSFDLELYLPVVRVGVGGGCAQSFVDTSGVNRLAMWNGFIAGQSPAQILATMALNASHQTKQYGVVDMLHEPVTFTGTQCGLSAYGVAATVGDIRFAIQGNVIVGGTLVQLAEQALLETEGDLTTKVMAAMEAARAIGGDGRCSCSASQPWSCEPLPPPAPFKSAHVGFFIASRIGDVDGAGCSAATGCATGQYYLDINVIGSAQSVDPVLEMQQQYAVWRAGWAGRPDHILSRVEAAAHALPADGLATTAVTVQLVDIDGAMLSSGGATLTLTNMSGAAASTTPSAVVDHGDGSYGFELRATTTPGNDLWRIVVDDGSGPVTLYPYLAVRVDPSTALHCGFDQVGLSQGATVPLVVNAGAIHAHRPCALLASASGTAPGTPFSGVTLPLNADPLFWHSLQFAGTRDYVGTLRRLDANGRKQAYFRARPELLALYAGTHIDWAGVVLSPLGNQVIGPVGFDVVP